MSGPSASRSAPNFARSSAIRAAVLPAYQVPYGGVPGRRRVAARPALEAGPDLQPAEAERVVALRLVDGPSRAATTPVPPDA